MFARDEEGKYLGIRCDKCGCKAPPSKKILKANGLNNMGWYCWGGHHFCPDHAKEAAS